MSAEGGAVMPCLALGLMHAARISRQEAQLTWKSVRLAFVLAALTALTWPHQPPRADPLPPDQTGGVDLQEEANIREGSALFSGLCAGYCHGSAGTAKRGPALRNRPDLDEQTIFWIVMNGRKRGGNPMPPWKGLLQEDQVWQLIAYIVSLREAPPLE